MLWIIKQWMPNLQTTGPRCNKLLLTLQNKSPTQTLKQYTYQDPTHYIKS